MLKAYSKFLDVIEKIEKTVLTATIAAMTAVMIYQVVLRYIFKTGNSWSDEFVRYTFIFNVMLAAAIAVRRNSHLQIDVLVNLFSKRAKAVMTIIATAAGIAFLCILFSYSIALCEKAIPNISVGLHITMAIPYAAMPVGIVLMVLTSLEVILKNIELLKAKEDNEQ